MTTVRRFLPVLLVLPPVLQEPVELASSSVDCPSPEVSLGAGRGALAAYFPEPDAYLEFFDLEALGKDVLASSLGELLRELGPGLAQFLTLTAEAEDGRQLVVHPFEGLERGAELWSVLVQQVHERAGSDHLSLEPEELERVRTAGGERISYLFRVGEPWEGAGGEPSWAMAWSLRERGAEALVAHLLPALEQLVSGDYSLTAQPREGLGPASYVLAGPSMGKTWLVVRDDLLAWTSDESMANHLRLAQRADVAEDCTPFLRARGAALERGETFWLALDSAALTRRLAYEDEEARAVLTALGLHQLGDVHLGLMERDGELVSRIAIEREGHAGLLGLLRGRVCEWRSFEALTADSFFIAGLPRSARDLSHELTELAAWASPDVYEQLRRHWRALSELPAIGLALEPEALGDELLFFARPGLGPQPHAYVCAPLGPALAKHFQHFQEKAAAQGGELKIEHAGSTVEYVRRKGHSYWTARHKSFGSLAWVLVGDHVVLSDSSASLRSYLMTRDRERIADREALMGDLRRRLRAATVAASEDASPALAGFSHVRTDSVLRMLWPVALAGLRFSPLADIVDDLPTVEQVTGRVEDTTVILLDREHALEWHGRGLLGGLTLLF